MNEPLRRRGEDPLRRGKTIVLLDLKQPDASPRRWRWWPRADALIEGNRPGVMERLGPRPGRLRARAIRSLVYGRMTGWGQSGPLAQAAGHDLNYVALTGLLSLSAHRGERPIVPPTVVGDAARRAGPGLRHRLRAGRRARQRPRPGGRWRHRRCGGDARRHRALGARQRPARRRRTEPVPRLAVLRRLRLRRRRLHHASARWSRSSMRCC